MADPAHERSVWRYFDLADCFVQILLVDESALQLADRPGINRAGYRRLVIDACMPEFRGDVEDAIERLFPEDPLMVEDLLYQHPKVADVAVIGLPDRERGERVCACVERVPGGEDLTLAEMVDYLRGADLMVQKIPEQLEVMDELPRNQTLRKILKQELRDMYRDAPWEPAVRN